MAKSTQVQQSLLDAFSVQARAQQQRTTIRRFSRKRFPLESLCAEWKSHAEQGACCVTLSPSSDKDNKNSKREQLSDPHNVELFHKTNAMRVGERGDTVAGQQKIPHPQQEYLFHTLRRKDEQIHALEQNVAHLKSINQNLTLEVAVAQVDVAQAEVTVNRRDVELANLHLSMAKKHAHLLHIRRLLRCARQRCNTLQKRLIEMQNAQFEVGGRVGGGERSEWLPEV